jgi:hypothetical protein
VKGWLRREKEDWVEFSRLPVFFSEPDHIPSLHVEALVDIRLYSYRRNLLNDTLLRSVNLAFTDDRSDAC